jgi:hypothetical protein
VQYGAASRPEGERTEDWKEEGEGENLVYFLPLCYGDSFSFCISLFSSPSLASPRPFLFLISTSCSDSCSFFHFFLAPRGLSFLCFISSLFPFTLVSPCSSFLLQSGVFLSHALFSFPPTFWGQLHAPAT